MTNVIFESYLHNIHLESNLIFHPVSPRDWGMYGTHNEGFSVFVIIFFFLYSLRFLSHKSGFSL